MQCIVLNVTERGDWIDQILPHPKGLRAEGLHVPTKFRPSIVHTTREAAEKEAARLACESGLQEGEFAVFELVAVVRGKPLANTDRVKGMGPCAAMVPRWLDAPVEV